MPNVSTLELLSFDDEHLLEALREALGEGERQPPESGLTFLRAALEVRSSRRARRRNLARWWSHLPRTPVVVGTAAAAIVALVLVGSGAGHGGTRTAVSRIRSATAALVADVDHGSPSARTEKALISLTRQLTQVSATDRAQLAPAAEAAIRRACTMLGVTSSGDGSASVSIACHSVTTGSNGAVHPPGGMESPASTSFAVSPLTEEPDPVERSHRTDEPRPSSAPAPAPPGPATPGPAARVPMGAPAQAQNRPSAGAPTQTPTSSASREDRPPGPAPSTGPEPAQGSTVAPGEAAGSPAKSTGPAVSRPYGAAPAGQSPQSAGPAARGAEQVAPALPEPQAAPSKPGAQGVGDSPGAPARP